MFKKFLVLLSALVLTLGVVSCSSSELSGTYNIDDSTMEGALVSNLMDSIVFEGETSKIMLNGEVLIESPYTLAGDSVTIESEEYENEDEKFTGVISKDKSSIDFEGIIFIKE